MLVVWTYALGLMVDFNAIGRLTAVGLVFDELDFMVLTRGFSIASRFSGFDRLLWVRNCEWMSVVAL